MKNLKHDFPIFKNRKVPFVYLDSGATSQKPKSVIDAVTYFYENLNANIHRGIYSLSEEATAAYEGVREKVAKFINSETNEVIFTGNTNESINLVVFGFAKKFLKKGDIVVLSSMEHHANLVPWLKLRDEIGIGLYFLKYDENYRLDYKNLSGLDTSKIKFVSLTQVSNVLGTINPVKEIIKFFRDINPEIKVLIDGAQSVPHFKVDFKDLGCDFLAFSSHKMLGPSGLGVLVGKYELLEKMDPFFYGSQMILKVTKEEASFAEVPFKFEVGTGKLEAVYGLGAAIDYLEKIGWENIENLEKEITKYALLKLKEIEGLELYGPTDSSDRLAIFTFNLENIHSHDVAQILDRYGICVRSGHHCAQVLMDSLKQIAAVRASFYIYNLDDDVDALVRGLEKVKEFFRT
ncbi:MAG TPA: SufS family cysteine desulfurase [Patescibacteria group bacterium]|nr:SufS family cysteine desulfurase [Patescibacteria group bacterium]